MDGKLFSDLEGLRIAIEVENNGQEFYQAAYDQVKDQNQRSLFAKLRDEEIGHRQLFTKMYETIKAKKEADTDEYLFDYDTSRYLTVLVDGHIFAKKATAVAKIAELTSIKAILEMALTAEKDSVLFYDELASNAKFAEAKQVFLQLKAEEQIHVVRLKEVMTEMGLD